MAEWIKKQYPTLCCLQETHFRLKDTYRLKVKEWKKILHANGNKNKVRVPICITDKIDIKSKIVCVEKEGFYMIIKESTQQEDITIIYASSIRAQKALKEISKLNGEIDCSTRIVRDFNNPVTIMDRTPRRKINQQT